MATSLNKVMLIGNLGRDAETRHTASGTAVTNFSVATTYRVKDAGTGDWKDKTDWHDVVLWKGERVAQYLTKGQKVFIEGRLQTRSYEDRNGEKRYKTEVVCDSAFGIMLLGGRGGSGEEGGGSYRQGGQGGSYSQGGSSNYSQSDRSSGGASGGGFDKPAAASEPARSSEPPSDDDDIPF